MGKKPIYHFIYAAALFLITEPLIKILVIRWQTGMEFHILWQNLIDNSTSFPRFFCFWVLSPLSGVLLLNLSRFSLGCYLVLSTYRLYSIATFTAYSWPFLSKYPHPLLILFEVINLGLLLYIFYPSLQRIILSKYLRNYWDLRGRIDCHMKTTLFLNGENYPITNATIDNISPGGALVTFTLPSNKRSYALKGKEGHINLIDEESNHHIFEFKVVSNKFNNEIHRIGIEFINVSPHKRILLRTLFIEKHYAQIYQLKKIS